MKKLILALSFSSAILCTDNQENAQKQFEDLEHKSKKQFEDFENAINTIAIIKVLSFFIFFLSVNITIAKLL